MGGIAVLLMAVALAQVHGMISGPTGDGFLLFSVFTAFGMPAWLIALALTATRWSSVSAGRLAVYNLPGLAGGILWLIALRPS